MEHFAKIGANGDFQKGKLTFDLIEREYLLHLVAEYQIYKEHLLTLPGVQTEDPVYFSQIHSHIKKAKDLRSLLLNPIEWN
jgi:hypothetical protein